MSSYLELNQDDMTARLALDAVTGQVTVFSQRKGITENDIMTKLGALNSKGAKVGLVLIVLMPRLIPQEANTPAPMYFVRYTVQVIDWPAIRRQSGGSGISAESMAERVRQLLHFASFGRGQAIYFDGMEPAPLQDENKVSYLVHFKQEGADVAVAKVAQVNISPSSQTGGYPITVTLSCGTAGAVIYFTTDGSYPSSLNSAAAKYVSPLAVNSATTLRAAAEATNYQQSDPSQGVYN